MLQQKYTYIYLFLVSLALSFLVLIMHKIYRHFHKIVWLNCLNRISMCLEKLMRLEKFSSQFRAHFNCRFNLTERRITNSHEIKKSGVPALAAPPPIFVMFYVTADWVCSGQQQVCNAVNASSIDSGFSLSNICLDSTALPSKWSVGTRKHTHTHTHTHKYHLPPVT